VGEPLDRKLHGRVRDELLNVEEFGSRIEAQVVVEAWRIE
jgi:Integrase core domain